MSFWVKKSDKAENAKPPKASPSTSTGFSLSGMIFKTMYSKQDSAKTGSGANTSSAMLSADVVVGVDSAAQEEQGESDSKGATSENRLSAVQMAQLYPVHEWVITNCKLKDFNRTRVLRNIKASAGAWWSRGVVGTEMEAKSRNIVLEWVKSIDGLSRCSGVSEEGHLPTSLWDLPDWAIDTFPTRQVFLSVQSHVERHFGMKLDSGITYSVAGILSSEAFISSSMADPTLSDSFNQPPMSLSESETTEWKFTPPAPFQQTRTTLAGPSESSVRIYMVVHVGKECGDFLRFFDSRSLRSKENPTNIGGELSLECPSWFTLMSWSDHIAQIKFTKGVSSHDNSGKQFWVIALDASKVRRKVTFSDVELLECEQLVRQSGYDFQMYLGQIEDRRRERLSYYESGKVSSGKERGKVVAKKKEEVHELIKQGSLRLTNDEESEDQPVKQEIVDDGIEEEEEEEDNLKTFEAKKQLSEKIRTRANTRFAYDNEGQRDEMDDLQEEEEEEEEEEEGQQDKR